MKCIKCSNSISQQRLKALPSTKVCVNCSTVEAVGCVDICYHKTGNTIQVMDKESAAKINKLSQRAGYGIMRGLRGGSTPKSKTKFLKNGNVIELLILESRFCIIKYVMNSPKTTCKDILICDETP